jgi:hypothetical protein
MSKRTAPAGSSAHSVRTRRSDSKISSKRSVTRAATSPLRWVAICNRELVVGRPGLVAAQVGRLPARAPCQPREAELSGELRRDAAGGDETILQSGVFVVDGTQLAHFGFDRVALAGDRFERSVVEVDGHAARHHPVHHQAVAEVRHRQPQPVFAQARELGQPETEGAVVAERAEIAEMVGHSLAFEHQGAQCIARGGTAQPAADSSAMQ